MLDRAEQHQFHQFVVAPPIRTTLPLHLSFSLHAASSTPNDTTSFLLPFDPYNNYPSHSQSHHHQHQLPLQTNNLLHHHHHSPPPPPHNNKDPDKELPNRTFSSSEIEIRDDDHQRQLPACASIDDSWSNDEVLAMLRIRSSMENWFPELTWDHVSRKLAELGFKKSAEKCKEKFEDENCRYFIHDMINYGKNINNNNNNNNNNYRFVGELEEEVYIQNPADHDDPGDDGVVIAEEKEKTQQQQLIGNSRDVIDTTDHDDVAVRTKQCVIMENNKKKKSSRESRKRKRRERLEVFKCFCEGVVKQMMAQQEEIHRRLLQDMLKRDEEKLAREEAWKRQEMERVDKELDLMAQEQAIAGDRQATIIEFLKNYVATRIQNSKKSSSCSPILHSQNFRNPPEPTPSSNVNFLDHQTTTTLPPTCQNNNSANFPIIKLGTPATLAAENPGSISSDPVLLQQVPSSSNSSPANDNQPVESNSRCTPGGVDVAGRRWPRDEVMALINLRCSLNNSINSANSVVVEDHEQHQKELGNSSSSSSNKIKGSSSSSSTPPVWERISEGMRGMGYNRSAKRCKEKWENINKYFRKTKDNNNVNRRKRSLDSRTCPYFHQLTSLYNTTHHGNQLAAAAAPQSHIQSPVNHCDSTAISGQIVPPDHHAPS